MADWYISSTAYANIPVFVPSTAYTVGQIIRPTAPVFGREYPFRCTTPGTAGAEPTWPVQDGNTITTGGAIFTNVAGRSAYGWSAAAGTLYCISGVMSFSRQIAGDRMFLSSDHSEASSGSAITYNLNNAGGTNLFGGIQVISVNRTGSVPPQPADYLAGAAIGYVGGSNFSLDASPNEYWQGVTFTLGGSATHLWLSNTSAKWHYFKNCAFVISSTNANASIDTQAGMRAIFDNTTVQFSNAGHRFMTNGQALEIVWINTPAAMLGTVPNNLFYNQSSYSAFLITCRGVDLSAVTTTLFLPPAGSNGYTGYFKVLLDSCRIAPGVTRYGTGNLGNSNDEIELINCYDGTHFITERYTPAGVLTTEFTVTLSGGATDNVGVYSHKLVTSSRADKYTMTLDGFWLDLNLTMIGSVRTATVEIISSASLNTDDISLVLEYLGTPGSSLASFVSSLTPMSSAAVAASTATWNSMPATPVKQKLQVTFTPQTVGRVRAQVRLGKPSTIVYINPQVMIA